MSAAEAVGRQRLGGGDKAGGDGGRGPMEAGWVVIMDVGGGSRLIKRRKVF